MKLLPVCVECQQNDAVPDGWVEPARYKSKGAF